MSSSPGPVPSRGVATLRTAAVAIAFALGACSPAGERPGAVAPEGPAEPGDGGGAAARYENYVALGDSFAALGPVAAPTTGPEHCQRSTRNYAGLLAERPGIGTLVDATCGSATIPDLTSPQSARTAPQFDALTPEVDLVTLSIGGNDVGFGDMVECIVSTPGADTGAPCRDRLELSVTAALDGLGAQLDGVYAGIRERSPDARIVTTAYLPLVPADGGCDFVARMSPGDVTWTRHVTDRINRIVVDAADRAGAVAVLLDDAQERSACAAPEARYTDFTGLETGSHPMHPTAAGHRAMADAVSEAL